MFCLLTHKFSIVDEVMDSPEEFSSDEINIRGIKNQSIDNFPLSFYKDLTPKFKFLRDDSGTRWIQEGRMIAVSGNLIQEGDNWKIDAKEIQTGCPSKYETE